MTEEYFELNNGVKILKMGIGTAQAYNNEGGVGAGNIAEGWIDDAIAFWRKNNSQ